MYHLILTLICEEIAVIPMYSLGSKAHALNHYPTLTALAAGPELLVNASGREDLMAAWDTLFRL